MLYNLGLDIDFVKDRLDVVHRSRNVIIYVEGNNVKNRGGILEILEILKKLKELLVRTKKIEREVCVNRVLPR